MKIRSITYFCNPKYPVDEAVIRAAGEFIEQAKGAYETAGYEVQTTRLATIPFPTLLGERRIDELPGLAQQLQGLAERIHVGYVSLGPALPEMPRSYALIPEAIAASQIVFFAGVMADKTRGLGLAAVRACAQVIVECGPIDPNGFANLRFAALANVKAGSPFFPAAYHDRAGPGWAIATEAADLAMEAFTNAKTIEAGRGALVAQIEKHGKALGRVAQELTRTPGPDFLGIDFSLSPFPKSASSLGTAFERLGVPRVGLHGSLAAAAILTECIDRADFARAGFSGLMLPVLEDATLGQRAADGTLTVKDLLLYSAVCGTGLDTIPLPGDTSAERLAAVLLDLAALALRLDKPLTARLMPVPGKQAGDPTGFDFAYFANSKVMALDSEDLLGALSGGETFSLRSSRKYDE